MKPMNRALSALVLVAVVTAGCVSSAPPEVMDETQRFSETIELAEPELSGSSSLEQTLEERRSTRDFTAEELPLDTLGQLFWAGQGITDDAGHRTAPSAGARYPIELYAISASTFMHYLPEGHRVEQRTDTTTLSLLSAAAFQQGFVSDAPLVLVITAVPARTEAEYGAVAHDLVNREAGHVAQNILLQATSLGLAAVPVGGFDPAEVARLLALAPGEDVLYLLPVGYPAAADGS
ncbi:MAG: SagB/ThcOx family dehydrogenase [Actinobacteria bacterium]|nr:SagB/ThcOx family dehydrogenase [Actinomycetota bacterium]